VVIANTEELKQTFIRSYPDVEPSKFHTITNGFDPIALPSQARNNKFTMTHAGALYLKRSPYEFLAAVRNLLRSGALPSEHFEVQFIGTLDVEDDRLAALLADEHIERVLRLIPTAPHAEALRLQAAADALLLLQPGFPLQVPRKVFEYFALRKRVLAITEAKSATAQIVREAGVGLVVENIAAQIAPALLTIYREWRRGATLDPPLDQLMKFSNASLSRRLLEICAALTERSGASPQR
jgi:hypothetical protein